MLLNYDTACPCPSEYNETEVNYKVSIFTDDENRCILIGLT